MCVLQKVPTGILDETLVKKKVTRNSSMCWDYYLFKDTSTTNTKEKTIPGRKVKLGILDIYPNLFFPPPARHGLGGHHFKVL